MMCKRMICCSFIMQRVRIPLKKDSRVSLRMTPMLILSRMLWKKIFYMDPEFSLISCTYFISIRKPVSRGESAALGHFSVSIFFWQVGNKESKNKYSSIVVYFFGSIEHFLTFGPTSRVPWGALGHNFLRAPA